MFEKSISELKLKQQCKNTIQIATFTVRTLNRINQLPELTASAIDHKIDIVEVKLATIVEGDPKAPFSIATTPRCRGGRYSFTQLLHFTLDSYLIMLSVKQGGIKYHFLSLWYNSTWDCTQVSRAIGEHPNRLANVR